MRKSNFHGGLGNDEAQPVRTLSKSRQRRRSRQRQSDSPGLGKGQAHSYQRENPVISLPVAFKDSGPFIAQFYLSSDIPGITFDKFFAGFIGEKELDFGNSGTSVRLMLGVVAGHDMTVRLVGDASLSSRPMGRVLDPLGRMGLEVVDGEDQRLPLELRGSNALLPIKYKLPVASAQVKSAILLAGLMAAGDTTVVEPRPTRDHTERMLRHFGAKVEIEPTDDGAGREITVHGPAELAGADVIVPGDPSSAAFLAAAALIVPGSELLIENVLVNETRTGFYTTLKEMGADLRFVNERDAAGEKVADIEVRHSGLRGVVVPPGRAPSMIDEYPMLAALAAFASGETHMQGLAELRVKESDRLAATWAGLDAAGVEARIEGDTLIVVGAGGVADGVSGGGRVRGGGTVATHLDHRIAMSFLVLGLGSQKPMQVDDAAMIDTSFPSFIELMSRLGGRFEVVGGAAE